MTQPEKNLLTENIFLITDEESLKEKLLSEQLILQVNDLILHDFEKLISLLYRIDISEQKLKALLQNNKGTDAARIISTLIIERQLQKIRSRRETRRDNNFDEEEKW
jgi:hypothetical protein